MVPSN